MASVEEKPDDGGASYFRTLARHYESLARAEPHHRQSDLFAAIATDYSELAEAAAATPPVRAVAAAMAAPGRAVASPGTGSLARWIGRLRLIVAPLTWLATPTEAK